MISDLHGLRGSVGSGRTIPATTVARDHGDLRMSGKPVGDRPSFPVRQKVDDARHDDRPQRGRTLLGGDARGRIAMYRSACPASRRSLRHRQCGQCRCERPASSVTAQPAAAYPCSQVTSAVEPEPQHVSQSPFCVPIDNLHPRHTPAPSTLDRTQQGPNTTRSWDGPHSLATVDTDRRLSIHPVSHDAE